MLIHRAVLPCLILALCLATATATAEPDWPQRIHHPETALRDWPTGLEVEGDRLYFTSSYTISMFDVSDPSTPKFLGASSTSGTTQRLAVKGGKAYTADYHGGLNVFDGTRPDIPRTGGHEAQGSSSFTGVGVDDDLVFVSGHGEGLGVLVLDASAPGDPQVEAAVNADQGNLDYFAAEHIRVIGDRIYLAGHDDDWGAFAIFSYTRGVDPEPQYLGQFRNFEMPGIPPTGASRRVEVKDNVAFINDTGAGIFLLDVANPAAPKQIFVENEMNTRQLALGASDFAISGDMLVALRGIKFDVRDISNPRAPRLRGELDLDDLDIGFGGKIAVDGTIAYVAGHQKVAAIDFSDPDNPVILGATQNLGIRAEDVQLQGDLAYVASNGIVVYDVSDPNLPVEVGRGGGDTRYHSLLVDGRFAVAETLNPSEFHLFDLGTDGKSPQFKDAIAQNYIVATALEGDRFYVYVGNSGGGLRSYDLSSSSRFTAAGNWSNTDVRAYSVRVEGDTLFAGTFEHGLGIFDFTSRSAPVLIGSLEGIVSQMVIDGSLLYALRYTGDSLMEVAVIDISDLSNPQLLGSVETGTSPHPSRAVDLAYDDGFLYVPLRYEDFDAFIFDVSDPTNPQLVRQCIGVEQIDRLEARDSHLFVASGYLGLQVYDTSLGLPKMTAGRDGGLGWNAPDGIPFPVQGSHDLIHWNHLGRFNRANLDQAIEALGGLGAGAPSYFRALER